MTFLDQQKLAELDAEAFRAQKPYPWVNPAGLLTEEGFRALRDTLPEVGIMQPSFGVARAHGQATHDRYVLEYGSGLNVDPTWHAFVRELRGPVYRRFLARMTGRWRLHLGFHWHYTPTGCSVSPHCDARHKLGSHIFYLNTNSDWDPSWGGETLILDDGGRFDRRSAPEVEAFDRVIRADSMGNRSLLFIRRANSWHGVERIRCPGDGYRKVFIVVLTDWTTTPRMWLRRLRRLRAAAA